ncbi:MAG: FAD-dependent oxidoreductase, partial [Gemmatimonadota bacterium]|nr:FAD-dependent oxidoreductase [Gemmatimonadota bacterium]
SIERAVRPAHDFAIAARDRYPAYVEELAEITGIRVPLNRLGILQVALTEAGVRGLRRVALPGSEWIERGPLAELEPTLGHAIGAVLNPEDGAVDNVTLLRALAALVDASPLVTRLEATVLRVIPDGGRPRVEVAGGESFESVWVVIAGGAWSTMIGGLPLLASVQPSRGQLIAYDAIGLRHAVYGPRGYLVPRVNLQTIAGTTMESVGFDSSTTNEGLERVRSSSEEIAPALSITPVQSAWAGLRPVTPDLLPLLGPDPDHPNVIYACGHSRNGILLAPLTADVVATMIAGDPVPHDLTQFRPDRF